LKNLDVIARIQSVYSLNSYQEAALHDSSLKFISLSNDDLEVDFFANLQINNTVIFVLETNHLHGMADQRQFFNNLQTIGVNNPVIIKRSYPVAEFLGPVGDIMHPEEPISKIQLYAATDMGALLVDGLGSDRKSVV